jgi:hypothetical protein
MKASAIMSRSAAPIIEAERVTLSNDPKRGNAVVTIYTAELFAADRTHPVSFPYLKAWAEKSEEKECAFAAFMIEGPSPALIITGENPYTWEPYTLASYLSEIDEQMIELERMVMEFERRAGVGV